MPAATAPPDSRPDEPVVYTGHHSSGRQNLRIVSLTKCPKTDLSPPTRQQRSLRRPKMNLKAAIGVSAPGLVNMESSSRTARNAKAVCCVCICGIKIDVLLAGAPVMA